MSENPLQQQAEAFTVLLPQLMRQIFRLDENDPTIELPLAQLRVCATLREEPRTMSVLSRELGTTLSATTQITDRMVRAQLVERITDDDDRRVKLLKLTPHAEALLQARHERRLRRVLLVLERLPAPAREQILDALRNLLAAGQRREDAPDNKRMLAQLLDE